jgi:hypothetical protein
VLILDDFAMPDLTTAQADDLHELVTERMDRGSLILTSTRDSRDWYPLFPNPVVAAATCSTGSSTVASCSTIDGESSRMRSHRAAAEKLRKGVTPKPRRRLSAGTDPGGQLGNFGDRQRGRSAIGVTGVESAPGPALRSARTD